MIEFRENCYIVGLWYATDPITGNNWLCCVQRDPKNEKRFFGDYRFRYVKGDKIFDSDDEKSWYSFSSKEDESEEEVIKTMDEFQNKIAEMYKNKDRLLIKGGLEKFFELAKNKEWMHMKSHTIK